MGKSKNSEHYDHQKARRRSQSKFQKLEVLSNLSEDEVMDLLVEEVNTNRNNNEYKKQKA